MIRIPAGKYKVGSTQQEREAITAKYKVHTTMLANELEARIVELPEFYVDEFPVTNAQYAAFIRDTGASEPYDWPLHATAARADHPVAGVGGSDAEAYAKWAGKRLPTPEEWEAAFTGFPVLPDRPGPCDNWIPATKPITAPNDPASKFGVHGHGQVCEWTCIVKNRDRFPSWRMMKGAAWMCQEAWSLRPAVSFFAFAPWCRQWTGLRCVADKDVRTVPVAALPEKGAASYHGSMPVKDHTGLWYGGGRGIGAGFPGIAERMGVACPEGLLIDDAAPKGDSADLAHSAAGDNIKDAWYTMRFGEIEVTARFKAGQDFFDMNYEFQSRSAGTHKICPSSCVNAGLEGPFYDLEGARSHVWTDRGGWAMLRSLPRGTETTRWISYSTLPDPKIKAILVAVQGKDSPYTFGYGRLDLTELPHLANNFCFSCIHIDPNVTLPPGGHAVSRSRMYCIKGGLEDLRRRFVNDFGIKS